MNRFCSNSKGICLAFVTALISGFSIFLNKFAVSTVAPPLVFTTVKNTIVALMLLFFVLTTGSLKKLKETSKENRRNLIIIGITGGALPFYLFFTGLQQVNSVNAAFIHKTLVIWVAILALPVLKEKLNFGQMIAVISLFASNLFVGGFSGLQFSIGELMIFAATILWSLENIMSKKVLSAVEPEIVMLSRIGIGSLILIIASLATSASSLLSVFSLNVNQWIWIGITAVSLFGYVFTWYSSLNYIKVTTATVILSISPVITNGLSLIFLQPKLSILTLIHMGILLLGLLLFFIARSEVEEETTNDVIYNA